MRKVLIISISLKILILIIISLLKNGDIGGYNTNSVESDDIRYEKAAIYYSQNARGVIDEGVFVRAYEQFNDYSGYAESFSLWHWFVCIVTYLFKYTFVLRIINILFSVLTAYYIYKLGSILFNKKTGKYALIFYSFNPYFFLFSFFLYKDQFIALIIVQVFYYLYIYFTSNKNKYLIYVLIVFSPFAFLRTGFSLILITSVLVLLFIRENEYSNRLKLKKFFYFLPILIIFINFMAFYFIDNLDIIQKKMFVYVIEREISESNTIAMFQISDISDFYKIPFSFVFALLQPINLTSKISSVSDFVGVINLFGIFLASGNILALFDKKIRGLNFTWIINALFIITLITSLGISRHYYFMLPFYVIFLSAYIIKRINFRKTLLSSLILTFLIIAFYLTKII